MGLIEGQGSGVLEEEGRRKKEENLNGDGKLPEEEMRIEGLIRVLKEEAKMKE